MGPEGSNVYIKIKTLHDGLMQSMVLNAQILTK
jgi:hypothetical protein